MLPRSLFDSVGFVCAMELLGKHKTPEMNRAAKIPAADGKPPAPVINEILFLASGLARRKCLPVRSRFANRCHVSGLFRWTSCFPFSVVAALRPRASREGDHLRFPHTRTPVNARNYILHLIKRVFNSMLLSKKFPPLLSKGAKETASESAAYRQSTYEPLRTAREKE
jgi:hypothetical protein